MLEKWTPITTVEELETAFTTATDEPIILFQHDPYCPISRRAYAEMTQVVHPILLIDVSQHHAVKRAIAERTKIRHESPQVIILRNGTAHWSASHGAITQGAVEQAVQQS